MARKKLTTPPQDADGACRIESILSVDDRGQMVLPKEIRDRARIGAGDKLALVTWEAGGQVTCISLVKADVLADMLRVYLGPLVKEIAPIG